MHQHFLLFKIASIITGICPIIFICLFELDSVSTMSFLIFAFIFVTSGTIVAAADHFLNSPSSLITVEEKVRCSRFVIILNVIILVIYILLEIELGAGMFFSVYGFKTYYLLCLYKKRAVQLLNDNPSDS